MMGLMNGIAGRRKAALSQLSFTDTGISLDRRITFTRSTTALRTNSLGTAVSTAIDVARANANQDYNPSTLAARGFLIEAGATNGVRNPRCEGASAGSPGTIPTNWAATTTGGSITRTVVGSGTESGIPYVDIRWQFSGAANADTQFDAANAIAALSGQTWTGSNFVTVVGGSTTNITFSEIVSEYSAASAFLVASSASISPSGSSLAANRFQLTRTLNNASTAFVASTLRVAASGAADITVRYGGPQLEQNAFATSLILPPVASPAATARGSDNASITNLASIGYSSVQGYFYAEFMLAGLGSSATNHILSLNDGTANNTILMRVRDATDDKPVFAVASGGVAQCEIDTTVVATANTLIKVAASWSANAFRFAVNGVAGTADTSGSIPTVTRLQIGNMNGFNYLNGWLPEAQYGPQLLTTAQLQSMTA